MDRTGSPLDTINAGRKRRATSSVDDLDRMLARLEGRADDGGWRREPSYHPTEPRSERQPGESWERRFEQAARVRPLRESIETVSRDAQRQRFHEDSLSSVSRIAQELQAMREEMRSQMGSGLQNEMEQVRREIQRLASNVQHVQPRELGAEFERLSDAVRSLTERSDDRSINVLRLELEQLRKALDQVAREETVRSVDRRWDEFDRRWSALESSVTQRGAGANELRTIGEQVTTMMQTLSAMPDSRAIRSLEDKVRMLAGSVEQIAQRQGGVSQETIALIETRLDEISRAIVASSLTAHPVSFDPEPFERIEARMTSLASQIDELFADRAATPALIDQIVTLSSRVDGLARRIDLPEATVERLTDQIGNVMARLDHAPAPDMEAVFSNLEERFEHLSAMLERRQEDAAEQGHLLFRELERRLGMVADRLDRQPAPVEPEQVLHAIDSRFAELAQRLESGAASAKADDRASMDALEARLMDIAHRLEDSARHPAIEPGIISSLEDQIAGLSAHLAQPSQPLPEFDDISPRLDHIEKAIAGSRDAVLAAARQVAVEAARSMAGAPADSQAASELTEELRALDALTRRSDERNAKTFEAIHDTLLKIVDRLGTLEGQRIAQSVKNADDVMPARMPDADMDVPASFMSPRLSPTEAAAAAAVHALASADEEEAAEPVAAPRKSMLSGLTRAFKGRKDRAEPAVAAEAAPEVAPVEPSLDLPLDPKLANRPLEPGSGAPDLGAIMKRVRDERGQPAQQNNADAAKTDFIAAARRAALAAAAEADVVKRGAASDTAGSKGRFGQTLKNKRTMMLMAATGILVVLAGAQLSSAFLGGGESAPAVAQAEVPATTSTVTAQTDAAAEVDDTDPAQAETAEPATEAAPENVRNADAAPELVARAAPAETADEAALVEEVQDDPDSTAASDADAPEEMGALTPASPAVPADLGPQPLREAAIDGDPRAMYEIASRYAEGRDLKASPDLAAQWYLHAAELGYAPAQYRAGNVYEKGIGVARDAAKAKAWYLKAAEQGNASAMHNLAVLIAMGAEGKADNEGAAHWFLEAADLGVKDSQFNLGILAAKGAGMPQNLEESYKWFSLVADSGDRDAASKRDEIAKALRPEQLEKAKAAAKLWKPRPLDPEANRIDIPAEWTDAKAVNVDMKQAVANIQTILNKNGYDAGPTDGLMGGKTKEAIVAFQKDNGMEPSGQVNETLVKALLERR
ncbi:MAG TPA: peptidoglycan-binding protein [Rhizobiaceae bacterium]|nr:peptidoglycan-binding protein [Rhizobiaceae bacterium]